MYLNSNSRVALLIQNNYKILWSMNKIIKIKHMNIGHINYWHKKPYTSYGDKKRGTTGLGPLT